MIRFRRLHLAASCIKPQLSFKLYTVGININNREVMFFAMSDDFWSSVILSPANLRKHYEKIVAKQVRLGKVKPPVVVVSPPATEFLDKMAKATEESKPMPKGFKEALKKGKK